MKGKKRWSPLVSKRSKFALGDMPFQCKDHIKDQF